MKYWSFCFTIVARLLENVYVLNFWLFLSLCLGMTPMLSATFEKYNNKNQISYFYTKRSQKGSWKWYIWRKKNIGNLHRAFWKYIEKRVRETWWPVTLIISLQQDVSSTVVQSCFLKFFRTLPLQTQWRCSFFNKNIVTFAFRVGKKESIAQKSCGKEIEWMRIWIIDLKISFTSLLSVTFWNWFV